MLPGKLCIGILEEDNPLKSYFRLKPLLVEEEGKYVIFDGMGVYPEEGCIRIVPDKNESSHFKARMRRMGRYCVLDLREHAGENDKIRPNKNYRGDETERNTHIVYSDVVREPAENMIFEIVSTDTQEGEWIGEAPGTERLLRENETGTWRYTPAAEDGSAAWIAPDGEALLEEELQRFKVQGFSGQTLAFAIRLPATLPSVIGAPSPRTIAPTASFAAPAVQSVEPTHQEPMQQREPAVKMDKPWISHDPQPKPLPIHGRMSPMQQVLAAQSGLNPKRGRSLQEIIEEKWRHSRVDQLGHPVPANAMGKPVENPLERALEALRSAWRIPELRDRLLEAVAEIAESADALENRRRAISDGALRRELEDMEAERLKALADLDKLRREKRELRERFKQEIREEEAEALREAVEKTRAAQQELQKYESLAAEARKTAEFAQDAFDALDDGRFEEKLRDFALTSRAAKLLAQPSQAKRAEVLPADEAPDREAWIVRMKRAFAVEGLELSDIQAANLLICAALNDSLLLSGEAASDKRIVARALARALGAQTSGRYQEFSGAQPHSVETLMATSELPTVALVLNANLTPDGDVCRGMCGRNENLLVISALADSGAGFPVSSEALERGFMLRLEAVGAHTPWRAETPEMGEFSPVRMQTLRDAFSSEASSVPAALERRLQKIRDALALHGVRISRYSLNLMWRYCAAMLPLGKISPAEALDYAFAQKALPCILAEAPVECLAGLKNILVGMPHSLALLEKPLPILI